MIDIYAMHFNQNGSIVEEKTLVQTVPAANEGEINLVSPKVSCKTGSADSFAFSVQPGTPYYDAFIQMRTFFYVEYDGDLIFYGRVLTIENGFYGEQKIKCEGAQAFFNDSYFPGTKEEDRVERTIGEYINEILVNHNEQLADPLRAIFPGEVPGRYSASISDEQKIDNASRKFGENGWRQTKSALEDLTSHYGGMMRVRHGGDDKLYLDWFNHYYRSTINDQVIEVGSNVIDLSSITEVNNIFTVVVPIGKGEKESSKLYIDGMYFPVGRVTEFYTVEQLNSGYHLAEDYIQAEARYGKIIKPQEFNEADTQEKLLAECAKWVKDNYQGGVEEFTVTAVDFHQIGHNVGKILCGDRERIRYPHANGEAVERNLTCTSVTFELYNPESNSYTFGIPASSLSKGYSVNSSKSEKDAESTPTPKIGLSGEDLDPYGTWWKKQISWLKSHKVWCKSVGLDPKTERRGRGPWGTDKDYILSSWGKKDGKQLYLLYTPFYASEPIKIQTKVFGSVTRQLHTWATDEQGRPMCNNYTYVEVTEDKFNREFLIQHRVMEYIYYEWGYDMSSGMPADSLEASTTAIATLFTDPNTGKSLLNIDINDMFTGIKDLAGNVVGNAKQWISDALHIDLSGGISGIFGTFTDTVGKVKEVVANITNGKFDLKSLFGGEEGTGFSFDFVNNLFKTDEGIDVESGGSIWSLLGFKTDGNVEAGGDITFTTEDGETVNSRDMYDVQLELVNDSNKFGSIARKYFGDPDNPDIVAYEFTQSIEDYLAPDGTVEKNLIIARVDGDKVLLGSKNAGEVVTQAMNHITNVVGDVEYVTDAQGHKYWKIKSGSGLQVERDGASFGVFDDGNLKGGVIVSKLADGTVTTDISGDIINLKTNDDFNSLTLDANGLKHEMYDADGKVGKQGGKISTLENTVDGLNSTVGTQGGQISTLSNTVDGLTSTVGTQGSQISTLTNTVNGLSSTVGTQGGQISTLTNSVNGLNSTVTGQGNQISTLSNSLNGLSSTVEGQGGRISTLSNTIDGLSSTVGTQGGQISTLTNSVNGLNSTVTGQGNQISTLSNSLNGLSSTVEGQGGRISTLSNTIDGLSSTVGTHGNQISTLTNTVDGLSHTVTQYGTELNGHETRISTLKNTVDGFETRLQVKDADGNVTAASIATSINNQGQAGVKIAGQWCDISANQITLGVLDNKDLETWASDAKSGTGVFAKFLTVKRLSAQEITTLLADIGDATIDSISLTGNLTIGTSGRLYADYANISYASIASINEKPMSDFISKVSVSGNTLTLYPVDGDPINFSKASHAISVSTNSSWYMPGTSTESAAKSAAATAMGTSTSNLTHIDDGKFKGNSWIWFKVSCGGTNKYYYTKVSSS